MCYKCKIFYFNYDGKLEFLYTETIFPVEKNASVLFIKCTELIGAENMQMACVFIYS